MVSKINRNGKDEAGHVNHSLRNLNRILGLLVEVSNQTSSLLDSTALLLLRH